MEPTLEFVPEQSKPGKYDVFLDPQGKKYIVLEGLDPRDIHTPGTLEKWTNAHYPQLETMYWILFFSTFAYLIYTYIFVPLYNKYYAR